MAYTLENIDPRLFNFASSLISVIFQAILTISIGLVYGILINWYLANGFHLPAAMFGDRPKNMLQAAVCFFRNSQLTVPVSVILVLYAIADFSHSVADLGLYFVPIDKQGDVASVMSLQEQHRNHEHRLLQSAGDPLSFRTLVLPKTFYDLFEGVDITTISPEVVLQDPHAHTLEETTLSDSFLSSIEAVAVGESPLAFSSRSLDVHREEKVFFGYINAVIVTRPDGPLASIPLLIPLNCSSSAMAYIEQVQGFDKPPQVIQQDGTNDKRIYHLAHIPNCSFTETRATGIYDDPQIVASIEEHSYTAMPTYAAQQNYGVLQGGELKTEIQLSPTDKALTRDREPTWLEGRRVDSIDGIQFDNVTVPFATTYLASGSPLWLKGDVDELQNQSLWYSYLLVGDIGQDIGNTCPPLLSTGAVDESLSCLAFVELECDRFSEDIEVWRDTLPQVDSTCRVGNIGMVWGRNFRADAELAKVVAGVYGIIRPHPFSYKHQAFMRNAIPAALFAMGTLTEQLSIETAVRAQVNAVYICFMLLPLLLAICLCITFCIRRDGLDVPRNPYHMLMLGKHCHENLDIPDKTQGAFPRNINRRLVLKRKIHTDGTAEDCLEIGSDFYRPLEDPLYRFYVRKRLQGKSDDYRNAWLRKRIYEGYKMVNADSARERFWLYRMVLDFLDQRLHERLEFLDAHERAHWFGLKELPHGNTDEECANPSPSITDFHDDLGPLSSHSRISAPQTINDVASNMVVVCTKERVKIRSRKTYCAMCLHNSTRDGERCRRVMEGCPACKVPICKEHWKDFDHKPQNWPLQ